MTTDKDEACLALTIGVLMIGSLYWDPRRQGWRDERVDMSSVLTVRAPIRYGRHSTGRGNTYTMVFSGAAGEGRAKVVRCKHEVAAAADLFAEAGHLWAAERNGEPDGRISAGWGCVALLCNPGRNIPPTLAADWARHVAAIAGYGNIPHLPGEVSVVSEGGLLQIPWPTLAESNESVPLDLLIATATYPTLEGNPKAYPSPEVIAEAWNADQEGHVEYFRNNVREGIRTFEDDAIDRWLRV
jgi:hypothetical protein